MKIAVFGATGGTGRLVVQQSLEKGYAVVAFTRSPQKLELKDDKLTVFEGDIQNADQVSTAIAEVDAVVSALGPTDNKTQFVVSRGMENILAGMKGHGVRRLVVSAGAGVGDPQDEPGLFNKGMNLLLKMISRNVYEDMVRVVQLVRESEMDWTVVRAPMLTDDPATGQVKIAWVGKGLGMRLSRADFAAFMLEQVEDETYSRQAPAICSV